MTTSDMVTYEQLIELGIYPAEQLNRVINIYLISGYKYSEALVMAIYNRTGYTSLIDYVNGEGL